MELFFAQLGLSFARELTCFLIARRALLTLELRPQGTSLIARLMGAVRNSNTRASHASVETPGGHHGEHKTAGTGSANQEAGSGAGGGQAAGGGALDSPHLAPDAADRRPSFSYLRRASDRRRRRRLLERGGLNPADDPDSPRTLRQREFYYPRSGRDQRMAGPAHHDHHRGSESGVEAGESDATQRRDSQTGHGQHRLRRSHQIYDEEGEQVFEDALQNPVSEFAGQRPEVQQQQQAADGQQRQSINDRLTDAVSDVMDFVREESVRRGKRHSMIRRRHMAPSVAQRAADGASAYVGAGGQTDDAELDSGDRLNSQSSAASYRRRRLMRRSPRRNVAHQMRTYNDSDSGASLSQDALMGANQRYRLQEHGGSAQDTHLLFSGAGSRGTALLVEQHRRHQSADAAQQASHYFTATEDERALRTVVGHEADDADDDDDDELTGVRQKPSIRPIPVGASPPPMPPSSEHEMLAAARRKREASDQFQSLADDETAIHVTSGPDDSLEPAASRPARFIAPKVTPLGSPSAMLMPDEEVVPPNVPYRGRRLPQIPRALIKSAANFLHSSIYGGEHMSAPDCAPPPAGNSSDPLDPTERAECVFPVVSESPTMVPKRAGSAAGSSASMLKQSADVAAEGVSFPRVSFSPTHAHAGAPPAAKYAASLIATQAGGSTQSSVLPSIGSPHTSGLAIGQTGVEGASTLTAWTRVRRSKKEEEDDWF